MDILQIPETFPINAHGTRVIIFHKKKKKDYLRFFSKTPTN
jgi:hypothetical protein